MERKCNSVFCRTSKPIFSKNPHPNHAYRVLLDENGNKKVEKFDIVSPSMAEDFSVTSNALLNRTGESVGRIVTDIVDIDNRIL